jgi:hypothetical protein
MAESPLRRVLRRPSLAVAWLRWDRWSPAKWHQFSVPADQARERTGDGELAKIFLDHDDRRVVKWDHYFRAYEEHFGPLRARRPLRFLEIGVGDGGSLQMWRKYFGADAILFGVDIDAECALVDLDPGLNVRIGSQDDAEFIRSVVSEMGGAVDAVLDDGSHIAGHQKASLAALWPLLAEGGVYAIEDLHASYWAGFDGGYRRPGTIVETAKAMVDAMHGWYHGRRPATDVAFAQTEVENVCFHDSIVFFTKRRHLPPGATAVGERLINRQAKRAARPVS